MHPRTATLVGGVVVVGALQVGAHAVRASRAAPILPHAAQSGTTLIAPRFATSPPHVRFASSPPHARPPASAPSMRFASSPPHVRFSSSPPHVRSGQDVMPVALDR